MNNTTSTFSFSGSLNEVYNLYYQFLGYFPESLHGIVSLALAVLLIYAIYKVIKRNFIFLIILVLLLPPAVPMLKTIWENVVSVLKFLIQR